MLGLDELEAVNVGAAPTPREVLVFFHAIGVEVAELWGMSETCGSGCCNPPGKVRIGTVGPPAPGVEIKLAEDGEVLMRSAVVMTGYRNLPERTAEALDADGWLHTGDIGEFDEEGYLRIVDRKKELIISAAGKNMSPANIESTLKGASPLIGQVCTIGDGRPYNTALIVLDADFAPAWAAEQRPRGRVAGGRWRPTRRCARPCRRGSTSPTPGSRASSRSRSSRSCPGDWAPGGDELTPTMKLKRKPIAEKYADRDRGDVPQVKVAAGIVLALAALAAGASPAAAVTDEPDLVIRLPGEPSGSSVAPVFVDAYEEPGKLLYRFDAVIANQGGTLDLFRGPTGGVEQAIYPGGEPPVAPKPDVTPTGDDVVDRSSLRRDASPTRTRRRTSTGTSPRRPATRWWPAARCARPDKVGFCMFDSFGPAHWFAASVRGDAGETWCGANDPTASTVRMGLSPGGADIYTAQLERQWVDITGLDPGRVVVRGEANPLHCVLESNSANNDDQGDARDPRGAGGGRVGRLVGRVAPGRSSRPQVPARRSGGCVPGAGTKSCYVWASAAGPLRFTSCASRRTARSRSRRAPTGCTRRPPTRRRRATPGPDSFQLRRDRRCAA